MSDTTEQSIVERMNAAETELQVAKAAHETILARVAARELVDRKKLDDREFQFFRGLRDQLLGMSARHAAVIAARYDRDPIDIAAIIDDLMYRCVAAVADQVRDNPVISRALHPDPILTVSEWADQHRMLSSRGASEAGPYRTDRAPYMREIMDCLSVTSPIRRVIFKKGSQLGATEAGNCWLGYIIDHAPGPVLAVQPTVETAKRFSKQRVEPLIAESPRLRDRVAPSRTRDSGNTVLMKEFTGGVLVMTGANSAVGLRSMPARYLFLDEVDAYPGDVADEGDPITLAEARTRTFSYRAKTFLVSTPLMKGTSVISREYERSDQRRYFVPCPFCGHEQVLVFDRFRYDQEDPSEVNYECEHCNRLIAEHHKTDMLARGRWKATAEGDDPHVRGYHLSALYSPIGWLSWVTIARQWEKEASKSPEHRKGFVNTILGEEWEEEADAIPDWQRLYERREDWPHPEVPERGLFLTAGADVQADRIEVDIWAWGRNLESWLVEHLVVNGDPGRAELWNELGAVLSRTWRHQSGKRLALQRLAIDTGAYTQHVYAWARMQNKQTVLAIKGVPQYDRTVPVSGPTYIEVMQNGKKIKRGIALWTVSSSFFKRELYKHLNLPKPTDEEREQGAQYPAGFVHLSHAAGDEWCKQLVAEQQVVVRSRRGFATRTEWRQLRPRNEALDCRVYARAATWLAGADRWVEARWRDLETQLGLPALDYPPPLPASDETLATAGSIASRVGVVAAVRRRSVAHWSG